MSSRDYLLRATAAEGQIRAFVCTTRDTAEEQRKLHNTSPIATVAIGRLMSAALMMGVDLPIPMSFYRQRRMDTWMLAAQSERVFFP